MDGLALSKNLHRTTTTLCTKFKQIRNHRSKNTGFRNLDDRKLDDQKITEFRQKLACNCGKLNYRLKLSFGRVNTGCP